MKQSSPSWSRLLLTPLFLLVLSLALLHGESRAATAGGADFQSRRTAADTELTLQCTALLRYMKLVDVYAAGLYLGDGVSAQKVLEDVPKRLEIAYFYEISARDLIRATRDGIAANVDAQTLAALQPSIEQMNALYEDVSPGDRYALTYLPGLGTELTLNGLRKGIIPGPQFATAIFSIWLGSQPINEALKRDLLYCS